MARMPAAKAKVVDPSQVELLHETKKDLNPFWSSSLFSDVYLKNDLPREYKHLWDNDEFGSYYEFYQGFLNLCHALDYDSFDSWREADTVKNWIVPVMTLLGWENNSTRHQHSYIDNTSFTSVENGKKQVYRPDLVYFDQPQHTSYTQKEKDAEAKLREARDKNTGAKIVVEAKYWNRLASSKDKYHSKDADDSASGLGPELQTLKYMELFDNDFGILTDGKTWKLFHSQLSQGMERRCFEFDLGNLIEVALDLNRGTNEQKFRNYSKYFFYFFSKDSIVIQKNTKSLPLVHQVLEYSKKYASSIEEDLKKRFLVTMGIACNAIKQSVDACNDVINLESIRNVSESHLFNILFVKSCEVRKVLPIQSINYLKVSLHEVIEALTEMSFDPEKNWDDYLRDFRFGTTFGGKKFTYEGFEIFNRFINLYEIIHEGTSGQKDFGFEISGFKESIFSKEEWRFAKKHKINNRNMLLILFNLNFIESSFAGRKYQQIPYSYFSPRQLGSIYESFLEFRLEVAESDMIFTKSQWSKANLKSDQVKKLKLADSHIAKKNELFFSPNNSDRKMSGSYYTPDFISKYMVKETIDGVTKNLKAEELLSLKICDPSMGSGHFLASSLEYLTETYRKKWSEENHDDLSETYEETSRKVLHSCIFGVDINPRAVKLAKMSLWLLTAYPGEKLEMLDDQLKNGDSLIEFKWKKEFKEVYDNGGFDMIVGNPPYIRLQNNESETYKNNLVNTFDSFQGNSDIYTCFIEKSLDLINNNGVIAFILPNKFLNTEYGKGIRKVIGSQKSLHALVNFKDVQIFEGLSTYTCLMFLKKHSTKTYFKSVSSRQQSEILPPLSSMEGITIDYTSSEWNIKSDEDSSFIKAFSKFDLKFEEACDKIFVGLQTSSDPVYILKLLERGKVYSKVECKFPKPQIIEIENSILGPLLKGSEISSSKELDVKFALIYPYDRSTNEGFTLKQMKEKYPKCYKYLESNKIKLLERSGTNESNWWLYSYKKNLQYMSEKKILGQVLSKSGNFNYDFKGEYYFVGGGTAGGYGIIPKKTVSPFFLIGILNSSLMSTYVSKTSSAFRGGYFAWGKQYIKDFKLPANSIPELVMSKGYKKIVELVEVCLTEKGCLEAADMKKINKIIFDTYEIEDLVSSDRIAS